ncbi:hypothetical protein D3C72_1641780 [compost metagenome]
MRPWVAEVIECVMFQAPCYVVYALREETAAALLRGVSAVGTNVRAGDERGSLADQKNRGLRDLFGGAESPDRIFGS